MNCTPEAYKDLVEYVGEDFAKELINSSIDPQVALERPYQLANQEDLPNLGFQWNELRGIDRAMVIPRRSADFKTVLCQIKPVGENYKGPKYRVPAGSDLILDVHPRSLKHIDDTNVTLWITEGVKQGDSLVSRGLCTVSLFGACTFAVKGTSYGKLKPCWDHIALEGREVVIIFDSDSQSNYQIQLALSALVERLEERKAKVNIVYLPPVGGNGKAGVDDFFTSGKSLDDLYELIQPFVPTDVSSNRLERDKNLHHHLSIMLSYLYKHTWKGKKGKSARSVLKNLIIEASKSGYMVKNGIKLQISQRYLAEKCGVHQDTVSNSLKYLGSENIIKRDRRGISRGKPDCFILLSHSLIPKLGKYGETMDISISSSLPPIIDLDSEFVNLRNTVPKGTSKRGVVKGTSKVRQTKPTEREGIKRLGKRIEEILDNLERMGASHKDVEVKALALDLGVNNESKLKYDLKELESLDIVELDRYEITTTSEVTGKTHSWGMADFIRLTPNWRDMLKVQREIAQEDESADRQSNLYRRQRIKYHQWMKSLEDYSPPLDQFIAARKNKVPTSEGIIQTRKKQLDKLLPGFSVSDSYLLDPQTHMEKIMTLANAHNYQRQKRINPRRASLVSDNELEKQIKTILELQVIMSE